MLRRGPGQIGQTVDSLVDDVQDAANTVVSNAEEAAGDVVNDAAEAAVRNVAAQAGRAEFSDAGHPIDGELTCEAAVAGDASQVDVTCTGTTEAGGAAELTGRPASARRRRDRHRGHVHRHRRRRRGLHRRRPRRLTVSAFPGHAGRSHQWERVSHYSDARTTAGACSAAWARTSSTSTVVGRPSRTRVRPSPVTTSRARVPGVNAKCHGESTWS